VAESTLVVASIMATPFRTTYIIPSPLSIVPSLLYHLHSIHTITLIPHLSFSTIFVNRLVGDLFPKSGPFFVKVTLQTHCKHGFTLTHYSPNPTP
jgi:hypothetical protein